MADGTTTTEDDSGSGLAIHAVVFAAVNLFLIGVWALFGDNTQISDVPTYLTQPAQARTAGFWPIYVILFWGLGLVIHAGIWAATWPARRRRRRARKKSRRELNAKVVGALGDNVLGDAAVAGIRFVDGDKAADRAKKDARKKSKKAKKAKKAAKAAKASSSTTTPKATEGTLPADTDGDDSLASRRDDRRARRTERRDPTAASTDGDGAAKFGRRASDRQAARQWVAVMFTDIVNSTPLNESLGDDVWSEALVAHRTIVRECIAGHRGVEVGTQGDGFLVRFEQPDDAADCAVALQRTLSVGRDGSADAVHIRIGIHAGEVVQNDDDLVGRVINLASRVTDVAEPDEILVTEPLADHLSSGRPLVDRGLRTLKGFDQPRHLLAIAWQEPTGEIVLNRDGTADRVTE